MTDTAQPPFAVERPARMIFIGGAHRSGTTLLQRIMGTHSQVLAGREFDFTQDIMGLRRAMLNSHATGRIADLVSVDDINRGFEQMYQGFFARPQEESGRSILCEKTPSNVLVLGDICDCMPDAFGIVVLRDPRAIAASMKLVGEKYFAIGQPPPRFCASVSASIAEINRSWTTAFQAMERHGRIMAVHYEDLVENPRPVIEGLCRNLGLPFESAMTDPAPLDERRNHVSDQFWYNRENLERPISTVPAESYTKALTSRDIRLIERFTIRHELLDRYDLGATSASLADHGHMTLHRLRAGKRYQRLKSALSHRRTGAG